MQHRFETDDTSNGTIRCLQDGNFSEGSCVPVPCTPTHIPNSNYKGALSLTGVTNQEIRVICDPGYEGGGKVTCQNDGYFTETSCNPITCTQTTVDNSNRTTALPITGSLGESQDVECNEGYIFSSNDESPENVNPLINRNGTTTCTTRRKFFSSYLRRI